MDRSPPPGNQADVPGDITVMDCATCREELSASLDGEDDPALADAAARHLASCAPCTHWHAGAAHVTRVARTTRAEAGPDLVDAVLARVTLPPPPASAGPWRVALAVLGAVQLLLGVLGLLGAVGHADAGDGSMMGAGMVHMSHEAGAWNVALGAAFLVGALRPRHLAGLLPALGVFLAVLTVLSSWDLLAGRVDPTRVASHLVLVVGFLLSLVVVRRDRGRGSPEPGAGLRARLRRTARPDTSEPPRRPGPLGAVARRRDAA